MPKSAAKESLASTIKCRRSQRIAYKIKSMAKGKSASSKDRPSSAKERVKLPYRKKSAAKTRPASKQQPSSTNQMEELSYCKSAAKTQVASSKEQPISTMENEKPSYSKKSVTKRPPESSDDESSTEEYMVKKRRVIKMDEIHERASQMGLQRKQDFSIYIMKILEELSPNLTISKTAIKDMNIYLNYVFNRLARTSAICLIENSEVYMTDKGIENAVVRVVEGDLAKYCIAEGRRAVKNWNEE